jgi:CelD/BcsL family acetyltransferase involved in cellulose biosynthesis
MAKSKPELEIKKIEETAALESLREDWNALLEQNETRTVELTYEWQTTYWEHFRENSEMFILVVRKAGSVVAIAPLRLTHARKFGITIRRLEFIAARESNYQDFIIGNGSEAIIQCILAYLADHAESWDVLRLTHVPESSATVHFLLNGLDGSLLCRVAGTERCTFLEVHETWDEYATNSKKSRAKIAYRMRRLRRLGEISHFHCSSEEQFKADLLQLFALHRKRWNPTDTPSQFNDDRHCRFYLDIIPKLFPKGQIDLFVLEVNESPVALLYSFLFDHTCLIQLVAYDVEHSVAAPSLVMHELFVKQAFATGIQVIDFGHYYPYKEYWADRFKNRLNIEIYPRKLFPYCVYTLVRARASLQSGLNQLRAATDT